MPKATPDKSWAIECDDYRSKHPMTRENAEALAVALNSPAHKLCNLEHRVVQVAPES